jgi:hypothetical protein
MTVLALIDFSKHLKERTAQTSKNNMSSGKKIRNAFMISKMNDVDSTP